MKYLAGEGGDSEESGADEEDLDHENGEKRLQVGPEMIRPDAGVVCPGREGAEERAQHHAGKSKDGGDERTGPASAKVGEFGDGLCEEDLVGVALEVAQDRGAEDRGDHDDAEKPGEHVVEAYWHKRPFSSDFAIAAADRTEAFRRHAEKEKTRSTPENTCRWRGS